MKQTVFNISIFLSLLMLPGCGGVIDWGMCNFYQGVTLCDLTVIPKQYVRTVTIYDQVKTLANFSVLWLAPQVVKIQNQINARRSNTSQEMIEKECLESDVATFNKISFYVLATHATTLERSSSAWRLFLKIDGTTLVPSSIKKIELQPVHKAIFGKSANSFRVAYHVEFTLVDEHGYQSVSLEHARCMQLFFRSIVKEGSVSWAFSEYPGALSSDCTIQECP